MNKWMTSGAIAAAALALSVVVSAQDKPAPKEHTMTGCLAKGATADSFIVTSTAEKGPKTIGIVSSKAPLAGHVGHKIDITGVTRARQGGRESPRPSRRRPITT